MQLRLADCNDSVEVGDTEHRQKQLEQELSAGLVQFLHSETVFSVKRLLPADIKVAVE